MDDPQEVVIVAKDGKEHVFPAGFDPKRAAAIVSGAGAVVDAKRIGTSVWDDPNLPGAVRGMRDFDQEKAVGGAIDLLPTAGAIAGSFAGPMGVPIGAAAGSGFKQALNSARGATGAPRSPSESVGNVAGDTALESATAGVGALAGKAVQGVGRWIGDKAIPLVRSAIKPTVTAMKQQAGASMSGLEAQAQKVAKNILRNRWATPEAAEASVKAAESELPAALAGVQTDAPARAARYVNTIGRRAGKQIYPGADQGTIAAKFEDLPNGPLGETISTPIMQPSPSGLVNPAGQPLMVPGVQTSRALRASMPADEALDTARATGRWTTKKNWGELKGAEMEAEKTAERGVRDSVKAASPKAATLLRKESDALTAKAILDRMVMREGSRDAVGLPAWVVGGAELAAGKVPVGAAAANWLRNNQLRAGFAADTAGTAMKKLTIEDAIRAALAARLAAK